MIARTCHGTLGQNFSKLLKIPKPAQSKIVPDHKQGNRIQMTLSRVCQILLKNAM